MRRFDLIVLGAGSGNSIIDDQFADWNVALIDDGPHFGGTCLNVGCIPTKMFVLPADHLTSGPDAAAVGVRVEASAQWREVRDRIFGRIDPIATAGERYRAELPHVTLYRESARFVGPRRLEVGGEVITANRVVVAAGSRAVVPDIEGLAEAMDAGLAHTSDTVMRIDEVPERVVVIGAGFIALEFAHVLGAFGAKVTLLARSERVLRQEDDEISRRATEAARRVHDVRTGTTTTRVETRDEGVRVHVEDATGKASFVDADLILVATGRTPNADRIDAAAGGLEVDEDGRVVVDEQQRTSVEGVWALGDISSPSMLKHVANHEARVVQHNLLHPDDPRTSMHDAIPHAVFGHPQIAAVGLTEAQARETDADVVVAVQEYSTTAYGWALEDTTSCCKLVADRRTGLLLGAHLIGPQAATLIQPLIQAMATRLPVRTMARGQYWIHPALTEVVENALLSLDLQED